MLHALPILQDGRAWQFIRFSIVGLVSNLCLLLIFALLVQLGAEPVLSSVLVYALGVLGVYAVHRSWSFRSKRAHFKAGPRYLVAHAIGASTQALILFIGHRILKIDPVVVQAAAMVIVAIVLYLLFENFVFGGRFSLTSSLSHLGIFGRLPALQLSTTLNAEVLARTPKRSGWVRSSHFAESFTRAPARLQLERLRRFLVDTDLAWILGVFALSRFLLVLIALPSLGLFGDGLPALSASSLLDLGARWDSGWYLGIIDMGYVSAEAPAQPGATNYAFFPLYPGLVVLTKSVTGLSSVASGVLVSNVVFMAALAVIYRYVTVLGFDRIVARSTLMLICFAPQSVVFSAIYAESSFLLFAALAMLAIRQDRPVIAGLSAACLSAVRPNGALFIVVFATAYILRRYGYKIFLTPWQRPEVFLPLALAPLGMVAYWWFCFVTTGDAFAQPTTIFHGWGWSANYPWVNLYSFLKTRQIEVVFWAATSLGFFICSFALLKFRLYEEFAVVLVSFLLFWSGAIPYSLLRYAIALFPIYIGLSRLTQYRPLLLAIIIAVFASLNCFMTIAWTLGKAIAI